MCLQRTHRIYSYFKLQHSEQFLACYLVFPLHYTKWLVEGWKDESVKELQEEEEPKKVSSHDRSSLAVHTSNTHFCSSILS